MKTKLRIDIIMYLMVSLFTALFSCKKQSTEESTLLKDEISTQKFSPGYIDDLRKRMEQRAIITAYVLSDNNLLGLYVNAVKAKLSANPQNDEAITFDEIATESPSYLAGFAQQFKAAYNAVLTSGSYFRASTFSGLSPGSQTGKIRESDMPVFDEAFYKNDGAQIYFPYSEDFAGKTIGTPFVTYHPAEEVEENEAFRKTGTKNSLVETKMINEDYVTVNPSLVINFDESEPGIVHNPNDPPPGYECNFLTYNTFSDVLDDKYVISATMPKIKLLRNVRSFIGGSNYITLYQCFAKPDNFNPNPTPALNPITPDKRIVVNGHRIKRKDKGKWINFGQIYNDDWRLVQYDNPMIVFVKRGWFYNPTGSVDVKVSGGVKLDTIRLDLVPPFEPDSTRYQWRASFNYGVSANLNITLGSQWEYVGSDYVTRRGLLANCVGDNFGNGTAIDAGENAPWATRKLSDLFLYYFKVRECHP